MRMRQHRLEHTVFNFCITCGNQLRSSDTLCRCCGQPALETNRVTLPRQNHDRRLGRDDDASDDLFHLL